MQELPYSATNGKAIPNTAMVNPSSLLLREAWCSRVADVRENGAPIIIMIAIIVLLLLAATIVAASIVLCASRGGVFDPVLTLNPWAVKVICHKL